MSRASSILIFVVLTISIVTFYVSSTEAQRKDPFQTDQVSDFKAKILISEDKNTVKGYKLTGDIHVEPKATRVDEYQWINEVSLSKVYWPNGGYTTFSTCFLANMGQGSVECQSDNGDEEIYRIDFLNVIN